MSVDTPRIYLDSNVVSDLANGKLSAANIAKFCGDTKAVFAFSYYSVLEAIRGDRPDKIAARALVIDRLARVWIRDPIWERDIEWIHFLTSGTPSLPPLRVTFPILRELMRDMLWLTAAVVPIDYTASYMACRKIGGVDDESDIDKPFRHLETVRKELAATTVGISPVEMNLRVAKSVVERYRLSNSDSAAMICKVATTPNKKINRECPSKEVEELLSEFRTSGELKNNPSNTFDFFHLWTALPSCSYFVSRDADAIKAARYVRDRSQHKIAEPVNPSECEQA
ncbi:MAG TPA: hypothetical protein VK642_07900 [Burkholderiales bacterium]|nr:hypothetical protein [Burkholderiales bacterium]